jgi:hypothetical protein
MGGLVVDVLAQLAHAELDGAGDAALGEWTEFTGRAFHLRRRLSTTEAAKVGPVIDIRGPSEAAARLAKVAHRLPEGWAE